MALLAVGWRLRDKRAGYAQALQGGGVGVLYLTVFAALRLYQLIPPGAAMLLLIGIAGFSAALALLQNGRSLALLGTSGGFLAPVLASTGSGSHVMLFSYYALLNAGVLAIALKRAWRELNVAGFAFTFIIGATWGARFYRPELFASTEPFLLLFFLMYVAVPILYARHQAVALRAPVDATLIFGTPLAAFGLQHGLVREFEYGAAFSAALLAAFYLVLASRLLKRGNDGLRLLVEAFFALGVVFATLAVPLAFEGRWTSAVWALEAAAILWIGVRQQRLAPRLFAVLLQFGAGAMFLFDLPHGGALPWLNVAFLGCAMVALAGLFSATYIERNGENLRPYERGIGHALLIWGALWWAGAGLMQIGDHVTESASRPHAALAWFALSGLLLATIARRVHWIGGATLSFAITPLAAAVRVRSGRFVAFAARKVRLPGVAVRVRRAPLRVTSARSASAARRALAACDRRVDAGDRRGENPAMVAVLGGAGFGHLGGHRCRHRSVAAARCPVPHSACSLAPEP